MEQQNKWHGAMDRAEHEKTYIAFLNYTKWLSGGVTMILLLLLALL